MSSEPSRTRDAWFVIRGYVYQVETTIDRWLGLRDGEHLELENGEDIDTVSRWSESSNEEARLLEQVKHLDRSITLNSKEARAALANFVEQRANAIVPTALRFRFLTTATPAPERAPAMKGGHSGIQTWAALRDGLFDEQETSGGAAALRDLLLEGTKADAPAGVSTKTWETYRTYIQALDLDGVRSLVDGFEWSTASPSLDDQSSRLRRLLVELGHATSESDAAVLHDALLAFVFRTLSKPGAKRLDVPTRDSLLRNPSVEAATPALERLKSLIFQTRADVDALTERVADHEHTIAHVTAAMQSLASQRGLLASVAMTADDEGSATPRGISNRSNRSTAVARIEQALARTTWLAIHGTSGSGKTELATLVAEVHTPATLWITARELTAPELLFRIRRRLFGVDGPPSGSRATAYATAAQRIGDRALVVIDDIPSIDADGDLGRELAAMTLGLAQASVNLVTTSAFPLTERLMARLAQASERWPAPNFTGEEIAEVFVSHSAHAHWLAPERVELVRSITEGHAELVVAAATYLRSQSWRDSPIELAALLRNEFTFSLQRSVSRRLELTVESASARELLFRCALSIGPFSTEDARAIAHVAPEIDRPTSCLSSLEGLWLQVTGTDSLMICPLAKPLASELKPDVAREVHRVLGERIIHRRAIGPIGVRHAIVHYLAAGEFDRALFVFSFALRDLASPGGERFDDAGLLELWSTTALPAAKTAGLCVYVRSLQIDALRRRGERSDFLLRDVLALARQTEQEAAWMLFTLLPHAPALSRQDFRATTELVFCVALGPSRFDVEGVPVDLSGTPQKNFVWHQAGNVRSFDEARIWIEFLSRVSPERRAEIAFGLDYELGCMAVCDRLWTSEARKPEDARDWPLVRRQLEELAAEGTRLGLPLLSTLADRARATVLADYEKNVDEAIAVCERGLTAAGGDQARELLLREAAGRFLVQAGHNERGVSYLEPALATITASFPLVRLFAIRWLSRAEAARSSPRAVELAEKAVAFARTITPRLPEGQVAKVMGDLALAHYHQEGVEGAWSTLADAARELYDFEEADDAWRDAAVLLAHVSGYMCSMATRGVPPDPIPRADGTYEPPGELVPGMFLSYSDLRAARYTNDFAYYTAVALCRLADWYEDDERAAEWAERATRRLAGNTDKVPSSQVLVDFIRAIDRGVRSGSLEAQRALTTMPREFFGWGILVLFVSLVRHNLVDGGDATDAAASIRSTLAQVAAQPPADPNLSFACRLFHVDAAAQPPLAELVASSSDEGIDLPLRIAARLSASLRADRLLEGAFEDHLQAAYWSSAPRGTPVTTVMRRLMGPFILDFWRAAAACAPFRFRSPALLRTELETAAAAREPERSRRVLSAIASSLAVNLPPPARRWLSQPGPSASGGLA